VSLSTLNHLLKLNKKISSAKKEITLNLGEEMREKMSDDVYILPAMG